jgi:MFS family permease
VCGITQFVVSRIARLSAERVDAIMSVVVLVGGVLGSIAGGTLADLCQRGGGPRRTIRAICALAVLCAPAGLYPIVPSVGAATVMLFAFLTIGGALIVMTITLFTIVVPGKLRGLCLAAMIGVNNIVAVALAPLAVSMLSSVIGGRRMIGAALASICVTSTLVAAGLLAVGIRCQPRSVMLGAAARGSG